MRGKCLLRSLGALPCNQGCVDPNCRPTGLCRKLLHQASSPSGLAPRCIANLLGEATCNQSMTSLGGSTYSTALSGMGCGLGMPMSGARDSTSLSALPRFVWALARRAIL
eukprot:10634212-Lingulodinium_polyedra.AAC.1